MRVLPSLSNTISFLSSSSSKEAVPGKYERDICNQLPHVKLSENFSRLSSAWISWHLWFDASFKGRYERHATRSYNTDGQKSAIAGTGLKSWGVRQSPIFFLHCVMKQFSQQDWDQSLSVFSSSIWLVALQVISQLGIFLKSNGRLIFFQRLLDDSHALLVRLSGGIPLERAQLFRSKARNPHIPVPLEDNLDLDWTKSVCTDFYLNIPNINIVGLPVLGKGTGLAHGVLNEVISNLKRKT